jgi:hypothetical protein
MFVATHIWKILLALAFCAALAVAVQFLRISRYEYISESNGGYLLRIDRWREKVCWIAMTDGMSDILQSRSKIAVDVAECD